MTSEEEEEKEEEEEGKEEEEEEYDEEEHEEVTWAGGTAVGSPWGAGCPLTPSCPLCPQETDYIMSYFDNGEDFGGDSDDNMDEAVY